MRALMHQRGLAFNLNAEVWRLIANSSHRVSSLFPVRELHMQAAFPLWEEVKGNNSNYHAFGSMFFKFFFFLPKLAHVTRSKANTRHSMCQSDSPLITTCYWEHRCGGI